MNKNKNIIEINGKQFDANTGKPLLSRPEKRSIDGVTAPKTTVSKATKRPAARPITHHAQQTSRTLMRTVVKKPAEQPGKLARSELQTLKPSLVAVVPKLSLGTIDSQRQNRAEQTAKSELIHRFSEATTVQPETSVPAPVASTAALSAEPLAATDDSPVTKAASQDLFSRALEQADAHQQQTARKAARAHGRHRHRTAATLIVGCAAVLMVGGLLLQQNLPKLHLRAASATAGFSASLPGYKPAGFRLGTIDSQAGSVALAYKSNSDQRAFTVTEKPSDWNNQTLLTSYVTTVAGTNYQATTANGNTIYIYGSNNATWLSNGVWYQLQTSGALSTLQITQLVASL